MKMLSVNIPFQGFYDGSIWGDSLDNEQTQIDEHWDEDPDRRDQDVPALSGLTLDDDRRHALREALWDATDWPKVHAYMAVEYVNEFADWLAETLDRREIAFEFEEMTSPAYYNFETDRLFAKIDSAVLAEVYARLIADEIGREQLADTIRARHTSYDGFISFYDNDPEQWLRKPLADWDHNELGTLIVAWARFQGLDESLDWHLYDRSIGGLYEEVYRALDHGIDWDALRRAGEDIRDEIITEERARDPHFTPPPPRDDQTLPLPL